MNKLALKYLRPSQIPTKACHGCGIGMIENWILQAIDQSGLKQEDVVFGTGIGCVGRQTYGTWGGDNFGATHGRALAVATAATVLTGCSDGAMSEEAYFAEMETISQNADDELASLEDSTRRAATWA